MRVLALVIAVVAALPVLASERVALVIGNANYKTAPLENPVNDARAMARRLSQLGFKVTKVENATRNQMERAIAAFERQLSPTKTGLFYYAGHGIQVRDRNFMVPVDANLNDESLEGEPDNTTRLEGILDFSATYRDGEMTIVCEPSF